MSDGMDTPLCLPAELTIYTVGESFPRCLQWVRPAREGGDTRADDGLRVAADAVLEVDAAGLQLLMSLSNALARQQRTLQLIEPSDVLSQACLSLGSSLLDQPTASPEAAR